MCWAFARGRCDTGSQGYPDRDPSQAGPRETESPVEPEGGSFCKLCGRHPPPPPTPLPMLIKGLLKGRVSPEKGQCGIFPAVFAPVSALFPPQAAETVLVKVMGTFELLSPEVTSLSSSPSRRRLTGPVGLLLRTALSHGPRAPYSSSPPPRSPSHPLTHPPTHPPLPDPLGLLPSPTPPLPGGLVYALSPISSSDLL